MKAMKFAGFVLLLIIGMAIQGLTLSVLWGWFIAPVFALPVLTAGQALGITCVLTYIRNPQNLLADKEQFSPDWWVSVIGEVFFRPAIALGIGAVVYMVINL